jgi:predicted PilT family ATPase
VNEKKNFLSFFVQGNLNGKQADFYIGDDFVFSATVGKNGEIKVHNKSNIGRTLSNAMNIGKAVRVLV